MPGIYQDKTITCADCHLQFALSAQDQEVQASRGFRKPPLLCPACVSTYGGGFGSYRQEILAPTCARCGRDLEGSKPGEARAIYCTDCALAQ